MTVLVFFIDLPTNLVNNDDQKLIILYNVGIHACIFFPLIFNPPIHMQFHYLLAVRKLAQTTPVQDSRSFVTATSSFQTVAHAPDSAAIYSGSIAIEARTIYIR